MVVAWLLGLWLLITCLRSLSITFLVFGLGKRKRSRKGRVRCVREVAYVGGYAVIMCSCIDWCVGECPLVGKLIREGHEIICLNPKFYRREDIEDEVRREEEVFGYVVGRGNPLQL